MSIYWWLEKKSGEHPTSVLLPTKMQLINSFIGNPVKVAVSVLLVVLFGVIAIREMSLELTPQVERPYISIFTNRPGAGPEEIETELILPQEQQLSDCIGPLQRLEDHAAILPTSDIFRFHTANEKWLLHTDSAAEVGLLRRDGDDYWGWVQILTENHIPYDLVSLEHGVTKGTRCWASVSSRTC